MKEEMSQSGRRVFWSQHNSDSRQQDETVF